jgi:hypothetical protein
MESVIKLCIKVHTNRLRLDLTRIYKETNQIIATIYYERWRNIHVIYLLFYPVSSRPIKTIIPRLIIIVLVARQVVGWRGINRPSLRSLSWLKTQIKKRK